MLAAVTQRVELGISVLQLPLRNPIELAHRVQSVQALSGNRLRLGVGSGSTRADFELLGYDYDHRFGTMKRALETMRKAWKGEPQFRRRSDLVAGMSRADRQFSWAPGAVLVGSLSRRRSVRVGLRQ